MAKYVDARNDRIKCVEMSREEAFEFAERIFRTLAVGWGPAPSVDVNHIEGHFAHRIMVQIVPR